MNSTNKNNPLTNPVMAANLTDERWIALHVPRFKKIRPRYEDYAGFLEAVLKEACLKFAPLAIVNARAKDLTSFAEKSLRKRALYTDPKDPLPPDPLVRMTDLCGGRAIVHTARQVEQMCNFIKEAFDIDCANSEDASRRLKPTEFGYRSVHYIVSVNPQKLRDAGITAVAPPGLKGLKAEVQVRTLLEHASADIGHDTLYKAAMKVPDPIRRQFATLAAVLESADSEFGRLVASLNDLKSNFGAWHQPDEVKREIDRLRMVLKCDPPNQELAVKIGQLALSIGEHQAALNVLKPFRTSRHQGMQRVCGLALTEMHWDSPAKDSFHEGMHLLEAACQHSQPDAETLCALAECWAHLGEDEKAGDLFRRAIVLDPSEPLSFCRFLEFEVARQRNDAMVRLTEPMIHRAMDRCRREIQAGINLPTAWSCLAVFQLLIGQPFSALESLAQVLTLCGKPEMDAACPQPCAAGRALRRTRETVKHLSWIREKIEGFDSFERFLLLALAVRVKDAPALGDLRRLASWQDGKPHIQETDVVVILSGGCAASVQPAMNAFRPHLRKAVEGLSFTLLSGGTRMGISGLAGDIAARSRRRIRAFGYLPRRKPDAIQADKKRFAGVFESKGKDFSPLDPLQGWTDLIAAGVVPADVKLLCYAPGDIARAECAIALALGARVGLVLDNTLPKDRLFDPAPWDDCQRLLLLPKDAMTLRAFLQIDHKPITKDEMDRFEGAARRAHEDYVKSATPKVPSLKPWGELDPSLKLSNYHQVIFWERTLRDYGLGLRPLTAEDKGHDPLVMKEVLPKTGGKDPIVELAQLEHGRWNVERLSYGWRHAESKDIAKKLNPCLVPWSELDDVDGTDYQPWDINAIHGLPGKLREADLELYKL